MTAAIFYHPEAYTTSGPKLMGRNAAGESFLRGFFLHSPAEKFAVQVMERTQGQSFADVANDTVVPTKPKVEILPFEQSGLSAIKDYSHFAKIAESYWSVTAWPNHIFPEIAPFFPFCLRPGMAALNCAMQVAI